MKEAVLEQGKRVLAAEDAPDEALCPSCGDVVILRRRRLMNNGGVVYYWRHKDGGSLSCSERSSTHKRKASI
jgi:predicted RNA-binding Zn-ribbon protein involved in translation (DUF1610 family)